MWKQQQQKIEKKLKLKKGVVVVPFPALTIWSAATFGVKAMILLGVCPSLVNKTSPLNQSIWTMLPSSLPANKTALFPYLSQNNKNVYDKKKIYTVYRKYIEL